MDVLGMAPSICLLPVPLISGFSGIRIWLVGFVQHHKSAILDAWRDRAAASLCAWEGFRSGPLLDIAGTLQLLTSSHVRER